MQVAQMMSKYFERQTIPQDILVETFREALLIPSNFPLSLSLCNTIAMKLFLKVSLPFWATQQKLNIKMVDTEGMGFLHYPHLYI